MIIKLYVGVIEEVWLILWLVGVVKACLCASPLAAAKKRAGCSLWSSELSRAGRVRALCDKSMEVCDAHLLLCLGHDSVVGSGDECDEEGQHHVDEERDEGVQVDLAKDPHQRTAVLHLGKCHKHVISIYQREQALRHHGQGAELSMIRSQYNPSTETVSQIDCSCTAAEADHIWKSSPQCDNQNIVFLKEAEVTNDSNPHQQSGCSQQDSTHII